jgi:hypothetical protein
MTSTRVSRRQVHVLAEQLSERDWQVLHDIRQLRLVSGGQLTRLHFTTPERSIDTAARCARRVLARLTHHALLVRLHRQVGGVRAGSAAFVYAIGPVGDRLLRDHDDAPRRRFREPTTGFLRHTLAVAELYVRLVEAQRAREVELLDLQAEPACWRALSAIGGRQWLKPDLFVALAVGKFEHYAFVEVDQGTEHGPAVLRKAQLYERYYRSGGEQARYGLFPRVVWLTTGDARADQLQRLLASARSLTPGVHVVGLQSDALPMLIGAGAAEAAS